MATIRPAHKTFFDIPAELRNMICKELAVGEDSIVFARLDGVDYRWRSLNIDRLWHACPEFRHEYGHVFFSRDVWRQLYFYFTITPLEMRLGYDCVHREVFNQCLKRVRSCTLQMPTQVLNYQEDVIRECEGILKFVNRLERVQKLYLELDFRCRSDFTYSPKMRNVPSFYPTERLWKLAAHTLFDRQNTYLQLRQTGQPAVKDVANPAWRWPASLEALQVWIHDVRRVYRLKRVDPNTQHDDWRQATLEDGRPCEEHRNWRLYWHRVHLP